MDVGQKPKKLHHYVALSPLNPLINEPPTMDKSEIKLIYFDSLFYLPSSIPLMHMDHSDKSRLFNDVGFAHVQCALFTETNRDELVRTINCVPVTCSVCELPFLSNINEVIDHIFSQPHIDQFMKVRGSISKRDFSFWNRLLKIFHMDCKEQSKELLLLPMSTKLDLHERSKHLTVEVSSASEQITAINHFISASLARSERIIIYCTGRNHCDQIASLIKCLPSQDIPQKIRSSRKGKSKSETAVNESKPNFSDFETSKFKVSSIAYAKTKRGFRFKLAIEPLSFENTPNESVVYLQPPGSAMKWPNGALDSSDPLSAICALDLCASHVQSSLMLIHGEEQKAAFRAFEMKFMHSNEDVLLPIDDIVVLRDLEESAKLDAEAKTTVDQSIVSLPHDDPDSTDTVTPVTPPSPAKKGVRMEVRPSRRSKNSHLPYLPLDQPIKIAPGESQTFRIPPGFQGKLHCSLSPSVDTVTTDVALAEFHRLQKEIKTMMSQQQKIEKGNTIPSASFVQFLDEIDVKVTAQEKSVNVIKELVRLTDYGYEEKRRLLGHIKDGGRVCETMRERIQTMRSQVEQDYALSPSKNTVISKKKEKPRMRKVVWKVTTCCIELKNTVSIPEEKSEKKTIVNEIEEKKWPEIFVPFDEEMGKKVDEIIRTMKDYQSEQRYY